MRRFSCFGIAVAMCLVVVTAAPLKASPMTMVSNDVKVFVDHLSDVGTYGWTYDGVSHMDKQWFWFRVDGDNAEQSIDQLSVYSATQSAPNEVDLKYDSVGYTPAFNIDINMTLTGGASEVSDLFETITIRNTSTAEPLVITFFQYADFDLGGAGAEALDDTVTIEVQGGGTFFNTASQSDAGLINLAETVVAGAGSAMPDRFEVGDAATILAKLTDGDVDDLAYDVVDGTQVAVGGGVTDVAWAFQWELTIAPGADVTIGKDKRLVVPEPATMALLGVMAVASIRRRRA